LPLRTNHMPAWLGFLGSMYSGRPGGQRLQCSSTPKSTRAVCSGSSGMAVAQVPTREASSVWAGGGVEDRRFVWGDGGVGTFSRGLQLIDMRQAVGLHLDFADYDPRALPWAGMTQTFGLKSGESLHNTASSYLLVHEAVDAGKLAHYLSRREHEFRARSLERNDLSDDYGLRGSEIFRCSRRGGRIPSCVRVEGCQIFVPEAPILPPLRHRRTKCDRPCHARIAFRASRQSWSCLHQRVAA